MKKFFVAACMLGLLLGACQKSHDNPSQSGTYAFTMGGTRQVGFAGAVISNGSEETRLSIGGGSSLDPDKAEPFGLLIEVPGTAIHPGTYPGSSLFYGREFIGDVTVVISKIADTYVEGSFYGQAGNPETGESLPVTDGFFKAPIQR